ncbi:hypothetical protein Y888_03285 [Mixta calida B021323]|nr:hypothetical protein Y888_03285 [Mixta calida B021323]
MRLQKSNIIYQSRFPGETPAAALFQLFNDKINLWLRRFC